MDSSGLRGGAIGLLGVAFLPYLSARFGLLAASVPFLVLAILLFVLSGKKREAI